VSFFRHVVLLWVLVWPWPGWASEAVERTQAPPPVNTLPFPQSAAQARQELQALMDQSIAVATRQLRKEGTFFPFLAGMTDTGKVELVGVPASLERPEPAMMVEVLKKAARQLARKKRFRAIALYVDYVAERKDTLLQQSGIRIELEHRFPDGLSVFIPYNRAEDGSLRLLTPQFMPAPVRFFVSHQPAADSGATSQAPNHDDKSQP